MASQEVKLLGAWMSPFPKRVEWFLKLKGIGFEYVEEDLKNKSDLLLKYNPINKKVPVLVHGGNPVVESLVIIDYIEDVWQENPILPQDPYDRAVARFWAKFIDEKFTENIRGMLLIMGEKKEKEAMEALDLLEGELNKTGSKFFGGDTVGLVDIVLGWITIWLDVIEEVTYIKVFDPHRYPSLSKWMENFVELPVVKENVPSRERLLAYYHKIRQHALALAAKT